MLTLANLKSALSCDANPEEVNLLGMETLRDAPPTSRSAMFSAELLEVFTARDGLIVISTMELLRR